MNDSDETSHRPTSTAFASSPLGTPASSASLLALWRVLLRVPGVGSFFLGLDLGAALLLDAAGIIFFGAGLRFFVLLGAGLGCLIFVGSLPLANDGLGGFVLLVFLLVIHLQLLLVVVFGLRGPFLWLVLRAGFVLITTTLLFVLF